jgi:hypothetical protein
MSMSIARPVSGLLLESFRVAPVHIKNEINVIF